MSLNINTRTNQIYQNKLNSKTDVSMSGKPPMQNNTLNRSNDGEFSVSEATKNFAKGLISPITSMFSSPKNFIAGVGMVLGSTALIAATGGAAAPILAAVGLTLGALQAGKAASQIIKAKNGDDVEKAFYDIGGATSTIGLSAIGAKSSLKQANLANGKISTLNAIKKCFTSAKDLSVECFNVFKSGYFKTNITTALKIAKNNKNFLKYSQELHEQGEKEFASSFEALKQIFPEEFQSLLKGRNKCQISIFEKMIKKGPVAINEAKKAIKDNKKLSSTEKQKEIDLLNSKKQRLINDPEYAKSFIGDRFGARLSLKNISKENMDKLIKNLVDAANRGDIEIQEIENYRGLNDIYNDAAEFYLSENQLKALKSTNNDMQISSAAKASGYSAIQLKIKPKNEQAIELQIRGKEVNDIADVEHFPYDIAQNKDIAKGNNKFGILSSNVKAARENLTEEQAKIYHKYIYDNYISAQAKEFGKPHENPVLPKGIDPCLSIENLHELYKKSKDYKPSALKKPYEPASQLSFIAGMEGANN